MEIPETPPKPTKEEEKFVGAIVGPDGKVPGETSSAVGKETLSEGGVVRAIMVGATPYLNGGDLKMFFASDDAANIAGEFFAGEMSKEDPNALESMRVALAAVLAASVGYFKEETKDGE